MNISGIYKIQSIIKPNRIYIGSAINIDRRWHDHLRLLRKNKQPNLKLQNHYNKYGESDLQFSILLGCDKEDLLKIEQYFIESYKPWFNICIKANSQIGLKRSDETKLKLSISHKGKTTWNKGKTGIYSEETRKKISDCQKGRHNSVESNFKRSESMKGKNIWLKGRKLSEQTKINIGNALRGKKYKKKLA